MKEYIKDVLKKIAIFLLISFILVLIAAIIQKQPNPLMVALFPTISFALFFLFGAGIILFFDFLTKRAVRINKLNKTDFLGNKELYRDILNTYSPVVLAYIDNMKYDYDISIVSGLLSLKNKNFIEFVGDKINIINTDFFKLDLPERYIICNIAYGKVDINKKDNELKEIIIEEARRKKILSSYYNETDEFYDEQQDIQRNIQLGYSLGYNKFIEESGRKASKSHINKFENMFNIKHIIIFIIIMIIAFLNFFNPVGQIVFVFGCIYICFYTMNYQKNPNRRNETGKELNEKLEGLKNYIKNYSLLKDKQSEDIILWEDYLIYSVIFNQNKNIILEFKKYYKN